MKSVNVKNVSVGYDDYLYTVIRECNGEYWYYGSYNDLLCCGPICREIGNGLVVESSRVEPIPM